jgi:hypothetical protein
VTVTRLALVVGALALVAMAVMAATGFTALVAPLVTAGVLILLVGGGNWIGGRSHAGRAPVAEEHAPSGGPTGPEER